MEQIIQSSIPLFSNKLINKLNIPEPNGRKSSAGDKFGRNKRGNAKSMKKSRMGFKKKKNSQLGKGRSKRGGKK